jgi:hypothetical protein
MLEGKATFKNWRFSEAVFPADKATGIVFVPFNVNRIHKYIKNPNVTQENTHRFIYLQTLATKRKLEPLVKGSPSPDLNPTQNLIT